jgi:hypothetical protein
MISTTWAKALHDRLSAMYGTRFSPPDRCAWEQEWAEALDADGCQIRSALSRCSLEYPDSPPTLGQFRSLIAESSATSPSGEVAGTSPRIATGEVLCQLASPTRARKQSAAEWAEMIEALVLAGEYRHHVGIQRASAILGREVRRGR